MKENSTITKSVLFFLDFYFILDCLKPQSKVWRTFRQIMFTLQVCSLTYCLLGLMWLLISDNLSFVEAIYPLSILPIYVLIYLLWVYDFFYRDSLRNVKKSVEEMSKMCENTLEYDRIQHWKKIENLMMTFYCTVAFFAFCLTPLKYWFTGDWELFLPAKDIYEWTEFPIIIFFFSHYFLAFFFGVLIIVVNDVYYATVLHVTKIFFDSILIELKNGIREIVLNNYEGDEDPDGQQQEQPIDEETYHIKRNAALIKCLNVFVWKHAILLEHCAKLEKTFSHYASLKVLALVIIIVLNANILVLTDGTAKKMIALSFVFSSLLILCFVAHFANELTEKTRDIAEKLFFVLRDFRACSELKMYLKMILLRSRKPFQLTLSKMFKVNNELMLSCINLTFSWYTLLSTLLTQPSEQKTG